MLTATSSDDKVKFKGSNKWQLQIFWGRLGAGRAATPVSSLNPSPPGPPAAFSSVLWAGEAYTPMNTSLGFI